MQVGVNSGEVAPGGNVARLIQVRVGHSGVPPVGGTTVGGAPERVTPGARRTGLRSVVLPGVGGMHPPAVLAYFPHTTSNLGSVVWVLWGDRTISMRLRVSASTSSSKGCLRSPHCWAPGRPNHSVPHYIPSLSRYIHAE